MNLMQTQLTNTDCKVNHPKDEDEEYRFSKEDMCVLFSVSSTTVAC